MNFRYIFFLAVLVTTIISSYPPIYATSVTGTVTIIQHPSITIIPSLGPAATKVIIVGSNFAPDQEIRITFVNIDSHSKVLGVVTSDSTGAFAKLVTIPARSYPGSYTIYAEHGVARLASVTFFVQFPSLTANPTSGNQESTIKVTGSNFALGEEVSIFIGKDITHHLKLVGKARSDDTGSFTAYVRIPDDTSSGIYFISAHVDMNRKVYAAAPFVITSK